MSDLIRRQDVLKICDKYNGQGWVWSMIRKEVEELPPVTPQPKTGHWISHHHGCEYECSECHDKQRAKSKYCPNCGEKMVEPQERSDKE